MKSEIRFARGLKIDRTQKEIPMGQLIAVVIFAYILIGCKTSNSTSSYSDSKSTHQNNIYETVNGEPQYAGNDDHFMVYWAIWRQLSADEQEALGSTTDGVILSLRDIYWTTTDCVSNQHINMDGETVWYLDQLTLGEDQLIKPIKEAPRAGFRYFSMLNLNSQHLRGSGPWVGPKKERGETMEQWDLRRHKAYLEWLHRSWAKGTKGQLFLTAEHRLYASEKLSPADQWIDPKDYPQLTGEPLQLVSKYSPRQWPIHFDERAHKPHLFSEPVSWRNPQDALSTHSFRLRLDWNWCDEVGPVKTEIFVPQGMMPPPGPNRVGRSGGSEQKIKVTEIQWP